MNKLTKEKRNQLLMVLGGIVLVVAVIYLELIHPLYQDLDKIARAKADKVAELQRRHNTMKTAVENQNKYKQLVQDLAGAEADIAVGDSYAWSYNLIRGFKTGHKVEIPSISEPVLSDVDLMAAFPYRQIRLNLAGTGYFHDIGKFLADFENTYPHIRVENLALEPTTSGSADSQKLSFRCDIVALIKANN